MKLYLLLLLSLCTLIVAICGPFLTPSHAVHITRQTTDDRGLTSLQFTQDGREWGLDYCTPQEIDSLKAINKITIMRVKILNVEYHRNGSGVCEGFFAVLFEAKDICREWAKGVCGPNFIATFRIVESTQLIEWEGFRVINVKNFNLNFRGDHFISSLNEAVVPYCKKLKLRESNFSAAAFPDQYKQELDSLTSIK